MFKEYKKNCNRWFIKYGKIAVIRKLSGYIRVPRAIKLLGAFRFRGMVLGLQYCFFLSLVAPWPSVRHCLFLFLDVTEVNLGLSIT